MDITTRRVLAVLGGMIAGFGAGLGFSQALDYLSNFILNSGFFKEYGTYTGRTFPSLGGPILVFAGTIIGTGVGMLICSAMREDRSSSP
jgi:hypothetical protein